MVDQLPAGVALTLSVAIVTIEDNDEAVVPVEPVEIGFDPVSYVVGEDSGTVELRVSVLSGVLTDDDNSDLRDV